MTFLCYKTHHGGRPASARIVLSFIISRHFLGCFCCWCLPYSSDFILVSHLFWLISNISWKQLISPWLLLLISPSLTYNVAVTILFNLRPFHGCNWYERFCISWKAGNLSWSTSANEHFGSDWAELLRTGCVTKPLLLWRLNNILHYSMAFHGRKCWRNQTVTLSFLSLHADLWMCSTYWHTNHWTI